MALYQKKWWQRLFKKKEPQEKIDPLKDIQAIKEFLLEMHHDKQFLLPELAKLEELQKELKVTKEGLLQVNLQTQSNILDKLLERYGFFQNDVDINGIRLKKISKRFLKDAQNAGMEDLVKEKKKSKWKLWW